MELITHWDISLFLGLNSVHNAFWDQVMYWVSDRFIWIPFYALLLYFLARSYGWKVIYWLVFIALLIALVDQTSVHLFKNVFQRLRPCHDPRIMDVVHLVNDHCGGSYGFVSSHAANAFALAWFLGYALKPLFGKARLLLILWAALVSYSRIYLGVHFPLDVLCGAGLGIVLAEIVIRLAKLVNKRVEFIGI